MFHTNSTPNSMDASSNITISTLLAGTTSQNAASGYRLFQATPQDGIDVLVWQGVQSQPVSLNVQDDWGRIQFCYTLRGHSSFWSHTGEQDTEFALPANSSCIVYTPGCRGRSTHIGPLESITIAIRPDLLREIAPDIDAALWRKIHSMECRVRCHSNADMHVVAKTLSNALQNQGQSSSHDGLHHSSLWLLGQSLTLTGLIIEAHCDAEAMIALPLCNDYPKLQYARDLLLADLTHAPTIAEIAAKTGLSTQKLKRGFRQLFRHSVYGLFQHERMHEARRKLTTTNASVMAVAIDMGYANASHFANAFHKQFGINPSSYRQYRHHLFDDSPAGKTHL